MKCKYHANNEAQAICQKCKNPICPDCTVNVNDKTVCHHCVQQNLFSELQEQKQPFSERFLFFICTVIPGAAHMHLGLFRRGLQLMLIVFGTVALASFINLDFLIPMIVAPTWFFSFFEGHHLKKRMWQGQPLQDKGIFDQSLFADLATFRNPKVIGISVMVVGVLGLFQTLATSWEVQRYFGTYYHVIRGSFTPIILILIGIYLLTKAKKEANASEEQKFPMHGEVN